jgi:hypothetical protein
MYALRNSCDAVSLIVSLDFYLVKVLKQVKWTSTNFQYKI